MWVHAYRNWENYDSNYEKHSCAASRYDPSYSIFESFLICSGVHCTVDTGIKNLSAENPEL